MNDEVLEKSKNDKYVKLTAGIADITDEEGLKQAYESKDGLHQHYNICLLQVLGTGQVTPSMI